MCVRECVRTCACVRVCVRVYVRQREREMERENKQKGMRRGEGWWRKTETNQQRGLLETDRRTQAGRQKRRETDKTQVDYTTKSPTPYKPQGGGFTELFGPLVSLLAAPHRASLTDYERRHMWVDCIFCLSVVKRRKRQTDRSKDRRRQRETNKTKED